MFIWTQVSGTREENKMGSKLELQLEKLKFIVGIGGPIMSFNECAQERGQISSNIVKQASYWRSSTNRNNVWKIEEPGEAAS